MRLLAGLVLAAVVFVAGCASAPQTAVPLAAETIKPQGARIGVAFVALPKPDTAFPGAGCLLCMATASVANSALTTQVHTWPTQDLLAFRETLAKLLRERGAEVVVVTEALDLSRLPDRAKEPNRARKDFSSIRTSAKIDKLLVIQIDALGATRNYSAYIATGEPRATIFGAGYIVDLATHNLEWYQPLQISVNAAGAWDEPPSFPGLSNAYFQAIEMATDQLRAPFSK